MLESKGQGFYFKVKEKNCDIICSLVFLPCNSLMLEPSASQGEWLGWGGCECPKVAQGQVWDQHHGCPSRSTDLEGTHIPLGPQGCSEQPLLAPMGWWAGAV